MNVRKKFSLKNRLYLLLLICVIPLTVMITYLLFMINNVSSKYDHIVEKITKANAYNIGFNEAAFIKMEGVSDIAGIDAAMKLGANHPMGPLELGDFIGLDICLAIMDVLYAETGDSKYRACPLLRKMVRGGNLGVKSGKGFYVYNADRTKTPVDAQ